jgi:mRNA interferase RelE/StbE
MFTIEVSPAALRDFEKLQGRIGRQDLERLKNAVSSLADEPYPQGVRKIKGAEKAYRIRVGRYRVIYDIYSNDKRVLILRISRRNETTYRSKEL